MIYRGLTEIASALLRAAGVVGTPGFRQRLALDPPQVTSGGVWLHAASVGELNSARALAEALARHLPVTVTTNSVTGRALAESLGFPARLAPLDVPGAIRRFLDEVQPSVAVTVENELWPNRSRLLASYGIANVVVGARMSARSAARWGRLSGLIRPMLARIDALSAQDGATETRLVTLGLPPEALLGRLNLKLLGPAQLRPQPEPGRERVLLAASTHEGEEALMIDAYLAARTACPELRFILAPRHPARGDAVAALLAERGLQYARRSQGAELDDAPVLLADTLNEMGRWYDAAGICITGGSFTDRGGHTPWEPAAHRCAILHGPDVANFAEDYAGLDSAGGSLGCTPETLAARLTDLLDPTRQRQMGEVARRVLLERAGDPRPLVATIVELARGKLVTKAANPDIT